MYKFDTLVEALLMEMPYIPVGKDEQGEHKFFDIELEKYAHNLDGLIKMFADFLKSEPLTDKYGNTIQADTLEKKKEFMNKVVENSQFQLFLQKYHNLDIQDFINLFVQNGVKK